MNSPLNIIMKCHWVYFWREKESGAQGPVQFHTTWHCFGRLDMLLFSTQAHDLHYSNPHRCTHLAWKTNYPPSQCQPSQHLLFCPSGRPSTLKFALENQFRAKLKGFRTRLVNSRTLDLGLYLCFPPFTPKLPTSKIKQGYHHRSHWH